MSKKTITDLKELKGKVVFVRVDFNVPLKNGVINDDNRIVAALPTINYLREKGARVVLFSHLGKVDHKDPVKCAENKAKNDMKFVAPRLSQLLGEEVVYVPETRGEVLSQAVKSLKDGQVLLMQNTRYEKGESKNDLDLASYWASLADVFVMDAFGSAHRAHSSTYGVPEILNSQGKETALGFLMQKEVEGLNRCVNITDADRPFVAILGGAKVSDKILVVEKLIEKADKVLIGGAITCTFLKALGKPVGNSRYEADQLDFALRCVELAKAKNKLVLPIDHIVADDFAMPLDVRVTTGVEISDGFERLDIGPRTRLYYNDILQNAKTVFWNGPMGVFENPLFAEGTKAICETLTKLTREKGVFTVIGGGDSASAASQMGYKEGFSHVSTGGGASLELIQNEGHLPGIDVIADK
ncbi:MAG: phosphoglycerate kinase [Erysipelotrichaceae bacterium]|nr:phosphoglycerate kinase [Erysipelotrichaceae bacterium]